MNKIGTALIKEKTLKMAAWTGRVQKSHTSKSSLNEVNIRAYGHLYSMRKKTIMIEILIKTGPEYATVSPTTPD